MYLFFDTETTGLPLDYKAPLSDSDNRPRMVQIAWVIYDDDFNLVKEQNYLIKPIGFTIPLAVSQVHGITTQRAMEEGNILKSILQEFSSDLEHIHTIVAHNIAFDVCVVGAEFFREDMLDILQEKDRVCTMLQSAEFVGITSTKNKSSYKRPSLSELHCKIFNKGFDNAHDALQDIKACARCFLYLKDNKIIKLKKNHKTKSKIDFDPIAQQTLDKINKTNTNIFLTGKAGTGKSTLLIHFLKNTKKKTVVLAPTGVAALNVGGVTIHSFFGFPTTITYKEAQKKGKTKAKSKHKNDIFSNIDTIVIDEISMVRADMIDCIDVFLQEAREIYQPFGGVQMIFIGDLYQLPPVVNSTEKEFFSTIYDSAFFFSSKVFDNPLWEMEFVELEKVYRQTDQDFVDILNSIRNKSVTDLHLDLLNKSVYKGGQIDISEGTMYLVGTNAKADEINMSQLSKIPGETREFWADVEGNFQQKQFPTDELLQLKVGAQVMFVANDNIEGLRVNGTIGKIVGFEDDGVLVDIFGGETVLVTEHTWSIKQYVYDKSASSLSSQKVGSFTQLPLMMAWAITIHKSQGKTFDKVIIDLTGTFVHGQAYVALSRCRNLQGLTLVRPMTKNHIIMDNKIIEFISKR